MKTVEGITVICSLVCIMLVEGFNPPDHVHDEGDDRVIYSAAGQEYRELNPRFDEMFVQRVSLSKGGTSYDSVRNPNYKIFRLGEVDIGKRALILGDIPIHTGLEDVQSALLLQRWGKSPGVEEYLYFTEIAHVRLQKGKNGNITKVVEWEPFTLDPDAYRAQGHTGGLLFPSSILPPISFLEQRVTMGLPLSTENNNNPVLEAWAKGGNCTTNPYFPAGDKRREVDPEELSQKFARDIFVGFGNCPPKPFPKDADEAFGIMGFSLMLARILHVDCEARYAENLLNLDVTGFIAWHEDGRVLMNTDHPWMTKKSFARDEWLWFASSVFLTVFTESYQDLERFYIDDDEEANSQKLLTFQHFTLSLIIVVQKSFPHHAIKFMSLIRDMILSYFGVAVQERLDLLVGLGEMSTKAERMINHSDLIALVSLLRFTQYHTLDMLTDPDTFSVSDKFEAFALQEYEFHTRLLKDTFQTIERQSRFPTESYS